MNLRLIQTTAILTLFSLFAGCTAMRLVQSTKIKKPDIKYVDYKAGTPDLNKVPVLFNLDAHNPNSIGLKNVFASYELYTEGKRFLNGNNIELKLAPNGVTRIVVPAEVVYKDVANVIGPIANRVIGGARTLPVTANIRIFGNPTVYNEVEEGAFFEFSFTTSQTVDVPLPVQELDKAKDRAKEEIGNKLKKLF